MNGTIRRSEDVFATSLDDTLIMMSVAKGRYYGLNAVGTRIWEMLEQETTEAKIVDQLAAEYEVTRDACIAAVANFINGLRERGLLIDLAC